MNDNWIEIVETLQPYVKCNSTEFEYQHEIESCLKILGWKTSNKTMQPQLTLGFGAGNTLRPDIILYKNGIPVLPIEIKRPDNVCNDKQVGQLGNYMRQLKSNIGLYFGENIRFYYDNPNDLDNPVNVLTIELSKEDSNGDTFCEMLSYEKFNANNLEEFCKEHYHQIMSRNNLHQRFSEYFAENNVTRNIVSLIKEKFVKEGFDENILEDELNKLVCRIEWKRTSSVEKRIENTEINVPASENNETEFSLDGIKYWGIGRFVLAVVKQYVSEHPNITLEELEEVFPSHLSSSGNMGVVRPIEFLNEHPKWKEEKRYFMEDNEKITLGDNTTIVVNRGWGNTGKSRPHFQRFIEHIRALYTIYSR